jgi:germination protein M
MKQKYIVICTMLVILGLSGCGIGRGENPVSDPEQGKYILYYGNQDATALVQSAYETQTRSDDVGTLVTELYEQLRTQPDDVSRSIVVPQEKELKMPEIEIDGGQLTLSFGDQYQDLDTVQELLCRSALAKTLLQIPDISCISIQIKGQPLVDATKRAIGIITEDSFVDSSGRNVNAMSSTELTLYYSNSEGDKLVPVKCKVSYDSNISMEKLVMNLLINPQIDGVYPTLPKDLAVLGVSVKDGICCVNLDSSFITNAMDVSPAIPIYSIVNSLTELSSVSQVQIAVSGSSDVMFKDSISLTDVFERSLDYVQKESGDES